MLNLCAINGRLTSDPELKTTGNGTAVCSFTVAVDRSYVKSGEERQADFIPCVAWRQAAEFVSKYFRKGSMIAVDGQIQTRNYEDKDGNRRKAIELVASNVHFVGRESKEEKQSLGAYRPDIPYEDKEERVEIVEEDLPF